jgi:hypothetical protein
MLQFDDFHSIANLNAVHPKPAISRFQFDLPKPSFADDFHVIDKLTSGWNNVLVQFEMF